MSKLAFFHDGPLYKDIEGNMHAGILNDEIIDRYFYLADEFVSVTRISSTEDCRQSTVLKHSNVKYVEIPNLNTLRGRLFYVGLCKKIIEEQVRKSNYVVARVPSYVANYAIEYAKKYKKPYLTEVVGCSWDSLWNYSWKGKILAPQAFFAQKKVIHNAPYVIYVTNGFLQKRYPTKGISTSCSNVQITEPHNNIIKQRIERIRNSKEIITIGTAAAVDVRYKGQQYVIEAMGKLKEQGIVNYRYELVGGGDNHYLKSVVLKNGVEAQVVFKGAISHDAVLNWIETIDIYAQPSRQEGLPRALIEAMSRGVPALGAMTGGIPELLEKDFIIRNDNHCIFDICHVLQGMNRDVMEQQALRNYRESQKYYIQKIQIERNRMLDYLKN